MGEVLKPPPGGSTTRKKDKSPETSYRREKGHTGRDRWTTRYDGKPDIVPRIQSRLSPPTYRYAVSRRYEGE